MLLYYNRPILQDHDWKNAYGAYKVLRHNEKILSSKNITEGNSFVKV